MAFRLHRGVTDVHPVQHKEDMQIHFCRCFCNLKSLRLRFYLLEASKPASCGAAVTKSLSFVVQVSERDVSQSADSPATDAAVSTSHNGPLTSGTSKPIEFLSARHVLPLLSA